MTNQKDLTPKSLLTVVVSMIVLAVVVIALSYTLTAMLGGGASIAATSADGLRLSSVDRPPEPRLQPNPFDKITAEQELEEYQNAEVSTLQQSTWVDEDAGIVTIPIDEAMRIVVEDYQ